MPLVNAFKKTSHSQNTKYGNLYFKAPTLEFKVTLGSSFLSFTSTKQQGDKNCSFIPSITSNEDRSTSDERVGGLNGTSNKTVGESGVINYSI